MSYIGRGLDKISNVETLDNITFDGSTTYALTKSSSAYTPVSASSILISIDGVVQQGNFSVSTTNIVFDWSPTSSNTCNWIMHYGVGVSLTPSDDSVTGAKIADDAIDSEHYTDGSIDAAHIASDAVTTAKILDDNITAAKMADNSIDSDAYVDASIDNAHLADNAVDTAEIADDAVTLAKMDGLARGKIIYGNASGNPTALTVGSSGQALTSDGTDISWGSAGASLSNDANNRVVTADGSGGLNGEANLTFDGTDLTVGAGTLIVEDCGARIGGANLYGEGATDAFYTNVDDLNSGMHLADTDRLHLVTGANKALSIDASGHVTTPRNPSFRAWQSTNTDYANGHTVFSSNITENFDTNSDFSNGTFTAPVTGIYLFQMSIYDHNASDDTLYDMGLTTSNRGHRFGQRGRFKEGYTGVTSMKVVGSIIADMDANDTAYVYSGNSVTFTNNANVEHAYFSGVLIG